LGVVCIKPGKKKVTRLVRTAQANADYWLAHTPADGVAPWDYDAPADGQQLGPESRNH
jgi:hypothetical protein